MKKQGFIVSLSRDEFWEKFAIFVFRDGEFLPEYTLRGAPGYDLHIYDTLENANALLNLTGTDLSRLRNL